MSLLDASSVWSRCCDLSLEIHEVAHPQLRRFSLACGEFLRVPEPALREDLFWRRMAAFIRRTRFDLAANPTPFNAHPETVRNDVATYREAVKRRERAYPGLAQPASNLLDALEDLLRRADAPLLEHMFYTDLLRCQGDKPVGLVVPEPRYLRQLRAELESLELDAKPLVARNLGGTEFYDRLIFCGPTTWFPDSVITSPRAAHLVFVHFTWVGPDRPPEPLLLREEGRSWEGNGLPKPVRRCADGVDGERPDLIEDMVPVIDWTSLAHDVPAGEGGEGAAAVAVGRLCVLDGNWAAFLRGHDESRVFSLRFEHGEGTIQDVPVSDLRPGDYVLLRTEGGGDYMVELAWRYLGDRVVAIRKGLSHWKSALLEKLDELGSDHVARQLRTLGAKAAQRTTVEAWATEDRIQPQDKGDFEALMRFLGLSHLVDEYWRMGRALFRARVRAGHRVRALLLEQVKQCDTDELYERGRADFRLEQGEAEISAFRVVGLAPQTTEVPTFRIQVPFRLRVG